MVCGNKYWVHSLYQQFQIAQDSIEGSKFSVILDIAHYFDLKFFFRGWKQCKYSGIELYFHNVCLSRLLQFSKCHIIAIIDAWILNPGEEITTFSYPHDRTAVTTKPPDFLFSTYILKYGKYVQLLCILASSRLRANIWCVLLLHWTWNSIYSIRILDLFLRRWIFCFLKQPGNFFAIIIEIFCTQWIRQHAEYETLVRFLVFKWKLWS